MCVCMYVRMYVLALTSPTGGGRSVGIVRSRTKAMEFSFSLVYVCMYVCMHVYVYVCMFVCMYDTASLQP
jgi:hypothetical protein